MRDIVIIVVIWSLIVIPSLISCNKKEALTLDSWSVEKLQGVSLIKRDDGWSFLEIKYPYGYAIKVDTGFVFDSYLKIALDIKMRNDTIFTRDNKKTYVLFVLSEQAKGVENKLEEFNNNSFTVIDTSFIEDREEIFQCRFGNIYSKKYTDAILGSDLVLFISRDSGIVGMYLSKDGEELFNKDYKEVIFYPKGEIYYKNMEPYVKVVR